ncbi:MAG: hypothetical protein NT007_12015 [Candidatus Kapabacteria bacterium]|nr:hypothetical protein [Candidatus Kapabacteria bacterium]
MKYYFLIISSLFCFSLFSCNNSGSPSETGDIHIKVIDSKTLSAIFYAQITTSPPTDAVMTDVNGEYTISCLPGTYIIKAHKAGYNDNSVIILVSRGRTTEATIILTDLSATNNPPQTPVLKSPTDKAKLKTKTITLTWSCKDPDNDKLKYDLFVGKTSPLISLEASDITDTTYSFTAPLDSTDYYWKVVAKDPYGASKESEIRIFTVSTTSGGNVDLTKGLIAFWSFDDGTAKDQTGNGYDGTLMNSPTIITGHNGNKALKFNGINGNLNSGSYVSLPLLPFSSMKEFTINIWAYEIGYFYPGSGEFFFYVGEHFNGWLGIGDLPDTYTDNAYYYVFSVGCVGNMNTNPSPIKLASANKYQNSWAMFTLTYFNGTILGYINGNLIGTKIQAIILAGNNCAIGKHWWNSSSASEMNGYVDDCRIYNRALTIEEINELLQN